LGDASIPGFSVRVLIPSEKGNAQVGGEKANEKAGKIQRKKGAHSRKVPPKKKSQLPQLRAGESRHENRIGKEGGKASGGCWKVGDGKIAFTTRKEGSWSGEEKTEFTSNGPRAQFGN